ncbi:MAG TPA: ParA family protein [Candidatus Deferrimicrobium sp.]|nr:ParA family protein [Candidatus Deferrimicrobium sp.]
MPTVISFANMKGGVGKTTLCVNLAFELFTGRKRVLVVDNDPQFNATTALVKPNTYINKCLKTSEILTIYSIYEKPPSVGRPRQRKQDPSAFFFTRWRMTANPTITLDVIPSRIELFETLRNPTSKEYLLDKFLLKHAAKYDYILIDCPPTPSVLTNSAFAASEFVVIPVKPDMFSTYGLPQFIGTLQDFKDRFHDTHRVRPVGVVFTDVPRGLPADTVRSMQTVKDTLEDVSRDIPVFDSKLSHLEVFRKTLWQAVPVQRIAGKGTRGKSQATLELAAISKELVDKIETLRAKATADD